MGSRLGVAPRVGTAKGRKQIVCDFGISVSNSVGSFQLIEKLSPLVSTRTLQMLRLIGRG